MDAQQPVVDLDASVGYLLKQAATALREAMEAVLAPLGLTVTQYSALELLRQRSGLSGSDLARGAFVTRQSMAVVLQGLERDGLVERAEVAPSGRSLPTRLTDAGAERLRSASTAVRGVEDRMCAGFGRDERVALQGLLERCVTGLRGSA